MFADGRLGGRSYGLLLRGRVDYQRDEAISPSSDGLYKTRLFRIVFQNVSDLANRTVDAVVRIEEYVLCPDPLDDLVPGDELSFLLQQQDQKFHRNTF